MKKLSLVDTKGASVGSIAPTAADGNPATVTGLSVSIDDPTVGTVVPPPSDGSSQNWSVAPLKIGSATVTHSGVNDAGDTITELWTVEVTASTTANALNVSYAPQSAAAPAATKA